MPPTSPAPGPNPTAWALFQFRAEGPAPSTADVAARFRLGPDDLDAGYGVVATDPADHLYVTLVRASAVDRLRRELHERGDDADPAVGVFADGPVEPFTDGTAERPGGS